MRTLAIALFGLLCNAGLSRSAPVPPAPPKTPAELLVGKWDQVSGPANEKWIKKYKKELEYRADGGTTCWFWANDLPPSISRLVYRVEGECVRQWDPDRPERPEDVFNLRIETLSRDALVLVAPGGERYEYRRLTTDKNEDRRK